MTTDYYIKIHERIHMMKVKKYLILNIIDHPFLQKKKRKNCSGVKFKSFQITDKE